MKAIEALNIIEELEERFADMYEKLTAKFSDNEEVAAVFYQMHLEEKSHADIARMQKKIVENNKTMFKNAELNMTEINKSMDNAAYIAKLPREDLPEICRELYMIESSFSELYVFTALARANRDLRGLLLSLGGGFSEHLELLETLMQSLDIEFEKVEGLKLRHPRVHFSTEVLVNDKIRMKSFDISESGMFLTTTKSLMVGTTLHLKFTISRQRLIIRSMVQNVDKGRGVGVTFLGINPQHKELIRDYINSAMERQNWKRTPVLLASISMSDISNIRMYSDALLEEGFVVTFTKGFVETVLYLNEHSDSGLLILSMDAADDMNMKFLRFIKENKLLSNLKVFILYNNYDPEFMKKASEFGIVTEFLPKASITPRKLAAEIRKQ